MAVNGLVVGLLVVLLGLIAFKGVTQYGLVPAAHPMAASARSKIVTTGVATAFFFVAIAGGVGAAAYFVAGRSDRAANWGMALPLALGVATFGFQTARYLAGPSPTAPGPSNAGARQAGSGPSDAGPADLPPAAGRPAAPAPPGPPTPLAPQAPVRPSPPPATAAAPAARPPAADVPAPPARSPAAEAEARAGQLLEPLAKDLDAACAGVADRLAATLAALDTPLQRRRESVRARSAEAERLAADASALAARLRGADAEARRLLRDAGLEDHVAFGAAVRLSLDVGAVARAAALDRGAEAASAVREHLTFLDKNWSKWLTDRDGQVDWRDKPTLFEWQRSRSMLEHRQRVAADAVERIRGR